MADDKEKPKTSTGSGRFSLGGIGGLRPEKTPQHSGNSGQAQTSEKDKK